MGSRVRVPPRSPRLFWPLVFSWLFPVFVKPALMFDTYCSSFGFCDQRLEAHASHPLLVRGDGVPLHFSERFMTSNGRDHVGAASGLCQTPCGGLPKPVG